MKPHVTIVGGGPAGLSFACSLANTDVQAVLIEKRPADIISMPAYDGREIALTHRSVRILKELGVWGRIDSDEIGPIKQAKVLDGSSPYFLNFERSADSASPLGYIVSNHLIRKALYERIETAANIEVLTDTTVKSVATSSDAAATVLSNGDTIDSSLIVAADARFSEMRRMMGIPAAMRDFGKVAIVCRMEHEKAHDDIAFECFHYGRTLAVLPLPGNQASIVITVSADMAHTVMEMNDDEFNTDTQARFENRLGEMKLISDRYSYPLVAVYADNFVARRFALIGDAAVGMHPVTAHGFNLGLSGQEILAKGINEALLHGGDIGGSGVLGKYQSTHRRMTRPMYIGTNEIVQLFTDDRLPARILRQAALRIANNIGPIKSIIKNRLTEAETTHRMRPRLLSRQE